MEKRALIAIALSVLILFAFRYYQDRRAAELAKQRPPTQQSQATATPAAPEVKVSPTPEQPSVEKKEVPAAQPGDTNAAQQQVVIDGASYRAVLDNRGAVITSWQLKDYKSSRGAQFEMIAATHDAELRPFLGSLIFDDAKLASLANGEFYEVSVENISDLSKPLAPPATVVMHFRRGSLSVEKRFQFSKDNYTLDCSLAVLQDGKPLGGRILLGQDIGPEQEHFLSSSMQIKAVSYRGGKVRRDNPPKEEQEVQKIEGDIRWVGLDMQYFSIIAIPSQPLAYFDLEKRAVKAVGLDGKEVTRNLLRLTIPENGSAQYGVYLGPKNPTNLKSVKGMDLSGVIDYGMFSFLVLPLLIALKWIHLHIVQNYGAAIIVLTFLITLVLFPFRLKQMLSMKKMAVVQPKIKEIQEKYKRLKKTDPRKAEMNAEVMAVYKEHNVNPLGGCLPLLLQMPLLFAFYAMLAYSIELRQAPFYGWIHDLSLKDPYYILPILMGITMFISQKMTPAAPGADPSTAKMMMIMPVVLTFLFFNYSSGLNLYFLCSNVFQVGFQKIAERWIGDGRTAK
ncbi:MAG: yidC [Acidobacteria bacterium]|nr:yidC [Acidobacteriota bacterium]